MSNQERLESLLKKKGIGPEGSKSLVKEELKELFTLLLNEDVSMTTKATILTALLLLEPNADEQEWLDILKENPKNFLPPELHGFLLETDNPFLKIIQKLIAKEELSAEECEAGMQFLFDPKVPEYLKGPFLEGERLKRESFTENKIFFDFLYNRIRHPKVPTPVLIDICDSYDGSNRSRNFSLFTAALLASAGYPTIVHGIDEVAPKFGYTSHRILELTGKDPFITQEEAVINLENPEIRWAYLDQKIYFEELYALKKMRKEMVKRPFLATFEKLLQPVRAENGNFIVTGYTHPHYKEELVKQLKTQGKCRKALILKGIEGSSHMSLTKNTNAVLFNGSEISETTLSPEEFGIPALEAKQDKSINAIDSFKEGAAALHGEKNYARENILYLSMVILSKFDLKNNSSEAYQMLLNALDSGKALKHWEKGNLLLK